MSSEGLEATETEREKVLQAVDEEVAAVMQRATMSD